MEKLVNGNWVACVEGDLVDNDIYRIPLGEGWIQKIYKTTAAGIPVTNISITNSQLVGNIYWVAEGALITITADINLPDGELMTMVEKVINATDTVGDIRTKAIINSGVLTMTFAFKETGNYIFRKDRLNEGLERINAGFSLDFEDVEFDVFV